MMPCSRYAVLNGSGGSGPDTASSAISTVGEAGAARSRAGAGVGTSSRSMAAAQGAESFRSGPGGWLCWTGHGRKRKLMKMNSAS